MRPCLSKWIRSTCDLCRLVKALFRSLPQYYNVTSFFSCIFITRDRYNSLVSKFESCLVSILMPSLNEAQFIYVNINNDKELAQPEPNPVLETKIGNK